MIDSIYISSEFEKYQVQNTVGHIQNLSRINVFIGENNSGKSRFLRSLFNRNDHYVTDSTIDLSKIRRLFEKSHNQLQYQLQQYGIGDVKLRYAGNTELASDLIGSVTSVNCFEINRVDMYVKNVYRVVNFFTNSEVAAYINHPSIVRKSVSSNTIDVQIGNIFKPLKDEIQRLFTQNYNVEYERIYIPILRGIRPIQNLSVVDGKITFDNKDSYKLRTIRDYFNPKELVNDNIFTGLSIYEDIKKQLLNTREKRNQIKDFEDFLSRTFFKDKAVSLIPHIESDVLYIGIGDDDERPIYELGDGIQSIIAILYPMFLNQGKNMIFYIEEPENHLHPGMQRIFLEALMRDEFNSFQYYITTHSNHFLDLTLDYDSISIYTFKKDKQDYIIENVNSSNHNALELLGVRNSSVFLSNCTIWVEGITDRLYLKKYLDIYQQRQIDDGLITSKYLEDIHYSFVEYGGGNITHWSFLDNEDEPDEETRMNVERICSKLFLVTDNDNAKGAKLARHELLEKNLGDRYYCLEGKEIENTLKKDIIRKYVEEREKNNTDLVFTRFNKAAHEKVSIGQFIEKNVDKLKFKYTDSSSKTGTISNKVEFCKKCTSHITEYAHLSDEAIQISKKLFDFIKQNNR